MVDTGGQSEANAHTLLIIASTDCGFGTFTKREWVIEPVVRLKLKAIRQGADIASAWLWGKKVA
jgi:5-methyltetrahydropteroyltriglutamate--homocysteine methyltransferase